MARRPALAPEPTAALAAEASRATVPIAAIRAGDRLRAVDADHVEMLAVSMAEHGLGSPIWVRAAQDGYALIAGAHRLAAARRLGWTEIETLAFEVDALASRIMEIDENLFRRDLSELDRAVSLAERKRLYEARHPEARRGGDRADQSDKFVSLVPSFAEATAKKLGVDARTVFRSIARTKIAPDVRRMIATTWIATKGSALDALARLPEAEQRGAAELMLEYGGPRTVALALARLRGATSGDEATRDAAGDQVAALLKAWRRAGQKARDEFVAFLREQGALDDDLSEAA